MADELKKLLANMAKGSHVLAKDERYRLGSYAEALKALQLEGVKQLVAEAPSDPVLLHIGSDATSLLATAQAKAQAGHLVVRRHGKELYELLTQRAWVKKRAPSGDKVALLHAEARPLLEGKAGAHAFTAAAQLLPHLRRLGASGMCISHIGADRAVLGPLGRLFRQRNLAYYDPEVGAGSLGDEAPLLALTHLSVQSGCAAHDLHNAFQWGLASRFDSEHVTDLCSLVESLRKTWGSLSIRLAAWLIKVVAPAGDNEEGEDLDATAAFWRLLGVPSDAEELVVFVNPRWDPNLGRLVVSKEAFQDEEGVEKTYAAVLCLYHFRVASESRWVSVSHSARGYLAACVAGLQSFVEAVRSDGSVTDFHLQAMKRHNDMLLQFCVAATVCGTVVDTLIDAVAQDDRLARRRQELGDLLDEELEWAQRLPRVVWQRLAGAARAHPDSLRHECLTCAHVSAGFLTWRIFDELDSYPWKLVSKGDVRDNLQALATVPAATLRDDATLKIKRLVDVRYNFEALVKGVGLLAECPFSTVAVEQLHGSLATVHRYHSEYGLESLLAHSLIHSCRAFFASSPEERRRERQEARLARIKAKKPGYGTARQYFFKALVDQAMASLPYGAKLSKEARETLMTQHGRLWQMLPLDEKLYWADVARAEAARREDDRQKNAEHVQAAMRLEKKRSEEDIQARGVTTLASEHRWSDEHFEKLARLLESPELRPKQVASLRAKALEAPSAPSPKALASLQRCEADVHKTLPALGAADNPWVGRIARRRELLQDCVLCNSLEEGAVGYLFLFARQNPMSVHCLQLRMDHALVPFGVAASPSAGQEAQASEAQWHQWRWQSTGTYVTHESFALGANMLVVANAFWSHDNYLVADVDPVAIANFVPMRAPTKGETAGNAPQKAPAVEITDAMVEAHPWLKDFQKTGEASVASGSSKEPAATAEAAAPLEEAAEEADLVEIDLQAVYDEVMSMRAIYDSTEAEKLEAFSVNVRGSPWTAANVGVAVDVITASTNRGTLAATWCSKYNLNRMASYKIDRYTADGCSALAQEWARKMNFFYNIWVRQADEEYDYMGADLASYEESDSFKAWVGTLQEGSPAWPRVEQLRALVPRL